MNSKAILFFLIFNIFATPLSLASEEGEISSKQSIQNRLVQKSKLSIEETTVFEGGQLQQERKITIIQSKSSNIPNKSMDRPTMKKQLPDSSIVWI